MKLLSLFLSLTISVLLYGQPPVQGDELTALLGQLQSSPQIQSLESYIGGSYEARGIKLHYNPDTKLVRIELFNKDNPWGTNIQQFQGKLPKELTFEDKIVQAKKKIGDGLEVDGEVSTTYFIYKQFELNNFDSYKLSAEYISGRLISLSLILVEGGSGDLMEDGTTNKSTFKGESLLYIVKKSKANLELQRLIELFENYHSYADKTHIIYAGNGLEVVTDYSGIVQELIVYADGQKTSQGETTGAFKFPLPYGLKLQDNRDAVTQKLGAPAGGEGSSIFYNYGPSRVNVFFGGNKIAKLVIAINPDFKAPTPPPPPVKKTLKP
jgi:hypothetical protein